MVTIPLTFPCQLIGSHPSWRTGIVAASQAMRCLIDQVERLAPASIPVLLLGESGTGKELLARGLHEESGRQGRFVPVNCAALPTALAESELFGHVRGAFTGAVRSRVGLIEEANHGTLFLDEVAELDPIIQAKLLRILEDGVVRKVGDRLDARVEVRIVCATNQDLATLVRERRFRDDLYYRLAGVTLLVPPLRERPGDIRPLLDRFVLEFAGSSGREIPEETLCYVERQPWPGNVRELRLAVHRAVLLAGPVLQPDDFGLGNQMPLPSSALPSWRETNRASLFAAVARLGSVSLAARELGVPRSTAYDWVRACRALSPA